MRTRLLLIPMFLCFLVASAFSQGVVLEDFENGARLPWNAEVGDSTLTVVPVVDTLLGINQSDSAGLYPKQATAFSLLQATIDSTFDLSTNNRISIQSQV